MLSIVRFRRRANANIWPTHSVELTTIRRDDFGAAQDRGPRRASRRDLRDGNASTTGAWDFPTFRHPPADRRAGGGAGEVRGRARSGPAALPAPGEGRRRESEDGDRPVGRGPWEEKRGQAAATTPAGAPADRARLPPGRGEPARPVGAASQIADVENESRFASPVLRRRQKRLLGGIGTERRSVQPPGCAAAAVEAGHCLHELRGRA